MFCPECGQPLPEAARFCPNCGTRVSLPQKVQLLKNEADGPSQQAKTEESSSPNPAAAAFAEQPGNTSSKRCTAALLLGTGTCLFGMLTLICRLLATDLRILGVTATVTFFLAPLACIFGLIGIVMRIVNPKTRGLFRAVFGLLLGLLFGALAAICLLKRVLYY